MGRYKWQVLLIITVPDDVGNKLRFRRNFSDHLAVRGSEIVKSPTPIFKQNSTIPRGRICILHLHCYLLPHLRRQQQWLPWFQAWGGWPSGRRPGYSSVTNVFDKCPRRPPLAYQMSSDSEATLPRRRRRRAQRAHHLASWRRKWQHDRGHRERPMRRPREQVSQRPTRKVWHTGCWAALPACLVLSSLAASHA